MRIALVYFSATGVTRSYADVIESELGRSGHFVDALDITSPSARNDSLPADQFDGFVFGFPVFADFAPSVVNDWIPTLVGMNKPCAMYFTYGARTTGYAHFYTMQLLQVAGFHVRMSAEFLGRHTFNLAGWNIVPDRPDDRDFDVAREFARRAIDRLRHTGTDRFVLQKPFGYREAVRHMNERKVGTKRRWTTPARAEKTCRMCNRCENECPVSAFDAAAGRSDPKRCIMCMHCVFTCPDSAIRADERMTHAYPGFLKDFCLTEEIMNGKQNKIITEPSHAAC